MFSQLYELFRFVFLKMKFHNIQLNPRIFYSRLIFSQIIPFFIFNHFFLIFTYIRRISLQEQFIEKFLVNIPNDKIIKLRQFFKIFNLII